MPVRSSFVTDPYLKHRSLRLDLAIIAETARTLVADREYPATAAQAYSVTSRRQLRDPEDLTAAQPAQGA
ncbi:MAG: hypothetical protein QOJ89_2395 [bacterium]|jgi:hypothetical protein